MGWRGSSPWAKSVASKPGPPLQPETHARHQTTRAGTIGGYQQEASRCSGRGCRWTQRVACPSDVTFGDPALES
eukprot:11036165-Karenia_brevis.AAC.1